MTMTMMMMWQTRHQLFRMYSPNIARCVYRIPSSSSYYSSAAGIMEPPKAAVLKREMRMFGDVREDNYYWLRDDKREDEKVLAYLNAENAYTQHVMEDMKDLQEEIYNEMKGRIKEEDMHAAYRSGPYFIYKRELKGMQYKVHCRRLIAGGEGPGDVNEVMKESDGPEEIILDENERASHHKFYMTGDVETSPDHTKLAYAEDTVGDEVYKIYVSDIASKKFMGVVLENTTDHICWIDKNTLLYLTQDETHRPFKAWCHHIEEEQSQDKCLYHEEDEMCSLNVYTSESKEYTFLTSETKTSCFVLFLKNSNPVKELKYLTRRIEGIDTTATHRGNHFFITRRSDDAFNSELLICPVNDYLSPSSTAVIIPHRPSVKIQEVQVAKDHLIVYERQNAVQRIVVYSLPPVEDAIATLTESKSICYNEEVYSLSPEVFQYGSSVFRYCYSSLTTPLSIYDYDMNTGISVLKKKEEVPPLLGDNSLTREYDASKYESVRKWATAEDGTRVPISIVYRKDLVKLDGSDPLILYGYGAYEMCTDPKFRRSRVSLMDRGIVYAMAHVRGGGELGRKWYEEGKLKKKKNTFTDFICCGEYLICNGYCAKDKLCITGRSAGGLLIGAAVTMRPDLFRCAVAQVPFLDVLTTMLDSSIPLTAAEWEEWGNPTTEEDYFYIKSYSPIDNIVEREYPDILVTAGLHDPRVGYWEPAKFVAKMREKKREKKGEKRVVLLKCDFGAGHSSMSGRYDMLKETALSYAFILKSLAK